MPILTQIAKVLYLGLECPSCGSQQLQIENAAPPHGQKIICCECGRFIRWIPSPATIECHQNLKARLEVLKDKVGGWDSAFVKNLIHHFKLAEQGGKILKLSPRQSEQLQRIEVIYLQKILAQVSTNST